MANLCKVRADDHNAVDVESFRGLTQGSSFLANPGLEDRRPIGTRMVPNGGYSLFTAVIGRSLFPLISRRPLLLAEILSPATFKLPRSSSSRQVFG